MYFKKLDLEIDVPSYKFGKKEIEYGIDLFISLTLLVQRVDV